MAETHTILLLAAEGEGSLLGQLFIALILVYSYANDVRIIVFFPFLKRSGSGQKRTSDQSEHACRPGWRIALCAQRRECKARSPLALV